MTNISTNNQIKNPGNKLRRFSLKKLSLFGAGLVTSLLVIISIILPIYQANVVSANAQTIENNSTINLIDRVDPSKPVKNKILKLKNTQNNTDFKSKSGDLTIEISNGKDIVMTNGKNKLKLKAPDLNQNTPQIVNDKVIFSSNKVDTVVESVDGGLRKIIVIKDKNSPDSYDFPVELAAGEKIELDSDGSGKILNKDKSLKAIILKPWARDKNNKELKTSYSIINGNILRQKIDFTKAVFPVTADPTWCGDFVTNVEWVKRGFYGKEAWSLRLKPTWCLNYQPYTHWSSWEELYIKTPYHKAWPYPQKFGTDTYWSMYNQFACHRDWVKWNNLYEMLKKSTNISKLTNFQVREYQEYYHLEPERPDVAYWKNKDNGCNANNEKVGKII